MNQPYAFIVRAKTRPEKAAAFQALFASYVAPSRAEPGCIEYHMLRDLADPTLFMFYEVWASKADLDVHCALPHMAQFAEQRMDYLEEDFDFQLIEMLSSSSAQG
jgi:quinol monooxygenase YgiN